MKIIFSASIRLYFLSIIGLNKTSHQPHQLQTSRRIQAQNMSPLSGILDNMCACSNYSEAQVRDEVSELRYRDDYFQMEQNSIVDDDDDEDEDNVTGRYYHRERRQRRQDRASKSAERSVRSLYGEEKQGFLFRDKLDFDFYHPQRPIRNVPSTSTDTTASMSSSSTDSLSAGSSISSGFSFSLTKLQKGRTLTTDDSRSAQKTPCSSTYETYSLSAAFPSFSSNATVHRDNRTRDIKRKWQSRPIQVDPIILSV